MDEQQNIELATRLMRDNQYESASEVLTKALTLYPNSASLHYLLGAVQAELENFDLATSHFEVALTIAPSLDIARLQLGLLYATLDNNKEAERHLEPLSKSNIVYIAHFAVGLIKLIEQDSLAALNSLKLGVSLNDQNDSLNHDMINLITKIENETVVTEANSVNDESDTHLMDIYNKKHDSYDQ